MIDNNIQAASGHSYKYESIGGKAKKKGRKTQKKKAKSQKTKKNKTIACKRKKSTGIFYFLN